MKTIKEIADSLSVSKSAVRKKLYALGIHSELVKSGNTLMINEQQKTLIIQAFESDNQPRTEPQTRTRTSSRNGARSNAHAELWYVQRENEDLRARVADLQERCDRLMEKNDSLTAALIAATVGRKWRLRLPWGKKGD